jgi:hypothetical protein
MLVDGEKIPQTKEIVSKKQGGEKKKGGVASLGTTVIQLVLLNHMVNWVRV